MPYKHDSPLKDKTIRKMTAMACYAEIALAAGSEWNPSKLEKLLTGRDYWEQSGLFRRMTRGIVPSNQTATWLTEKLGNQCEVLYWRDHPFWKLLSLNPLNHRDILTVLDSVHPDIGQLLWHKVESSYSQDDLRGNRVMPTTEHMLDIYNVGNFDAFAILVAYAREGRDSGFFKQFLFAAGLSASMYHKMVTQCPHLYISWKTLAKRLNAVIWEPKQEFKFESQFEVDIPEFEELIKSFSKSARDAGIQLPPNTLIKRFSRSRMRTA